jgi:F0F1-type ATP synthase membrane subunit c/vacuolar-type H+-ATPase subunit K
MTPDIISMIGVILASCSSSLAAIFAIITAGTAMAGAGTEKPEILTKALISVVLAEAIAIYGLLTSFMLITKLPIITAMPEVEASTAAYKALAAGIIMSVSSIAAGFGIAYAGSAMAGAMVEKPETFSKNVVSVVLAEAIAIYGLLISFMMIAGIG